MTERSMKHVREVIGETVAKWLKAVTDADLQAYVVTLLDNRKQEIVLELVGLEKSHWGENVIVWGSRGAQVWRYLQENLPAHLEQWVKDTLGTPPDLTGKQKAALRIEYEKNYYDRLKKQIVELARGHADNDARGYVDEFMADIKPSYVLGPLAKKDREARKWE